MMRRSWAVLGPLVLAGSLGCLSAFGPDLRARDQHAGLEPRTPRDACMGCHVSEPEAIAMGVDEAHPAPAPIVAAWMLDDARECVVCHRVHVAPPPATAWQLAPVAAPGVADVR